MKKNTFREEDIKMRTEADATYDEVPIVARCPSYQQPLEEAEEQTREAMKQRNMRYDS